MNNDLDEPIGLIEISVRSSNVLLNAGFKTMRELCNYPKHKLKSLRSLGYRSIKEIEEFLAKYGSCLDGDDSRELEQLSMRLDSLKNLIEGLSDRLDYLKKKNELKKP
jgi:DNA-directed RNA polymerase alpha subunit